MSKKNNIKNLDEFYYHEALDRTHLFLCMIDDHLKNHPVIKKHVELTETIEKIEDLLSDLYKEIGDFRFNLFNNNQSLEKE